MECRAKLRRQPALQAEVAVPDQPFEKRIDKRYDQRRRAQLRDETRAFGNAAGNDRRDGGSKGQQEEKLHQAIAVVSREHRRRLHEGDAIGDPIAYKEIGQGRDGEVAEDFRQRVDLVLLPDRADLQKGETGVHRQYHHRTDQNEQRVGAVNQRVHSALQIFHEEADPRLKGTKAVHAGISCTKLRLTSLSTAGSTN